MSLRAEIERLSKSSGIGDLRFPALERLARGALAGVPRGGQSPEDLVQDFWLRTLSSTGREKDGGFQALLALDDELLLFVVRRRLRQLAVEAAPNWNLRRALRSMVQRALQQLPEMPPSPPGNIRKGAKQRLSQELVSLAVAWVMAQPDPPQPTARDVIRRLLELYPPPKEDAIEDDQGRDDDARVAAAHGVRPGRSNPLDEIRRELDGKVIADILVEALGPAQLDLLLRRYRGDTFEEIARDEGLALATVHGRYRRAIADVQSHLRNAGLISLRTASRAFQKLLRLRPRD